LRCKVCSSTFNADNRYKKSIKAKYYCPHCGGALFRWKTRLDVIMHKCGNKDCTYRLNALKQLTPAEHNLRRSKSSQFKLCYIYREYLFQAKDLVVYIFSQFWTLEPDLSLQIAPGQGHCFVG
jgi:hypothetical protein